MIPPELSAAGEVAMGFFFDLSREAETRRGDDLDGAERLVRFGLSRVQHPGIELAPVVRCPKCAALHIEARVSEDGLFYIRSCQECGATA